jgi:PPOX class probable F420-dependent enzyme
MSFIDTTTPFGERAARRLRESRIGWLTTVRRDGLPQPSPVWFLWDGEDTFFLFSQPDAQKLRNIRRNPRVSLNLDGDGSGGDIVIVSADAEIDEQAPAAHEVPAYVAKYGWGFERLRMTAEQFAATYSVPVRLRATRLRGH